MIDVEKVKLDPEEVKGLKSYDVPSWFCSAIYVESNALDIGKTFGLPTLDEVDKYISENHPELIAV